MLNEFCSNVYLNENSLIKQRVTNKAINLHFRFNPFMSFILGNRRLPDSFIQHHREVLQDVPFYDFEQILYLHSGLQKSPYLSPIENGETGTYSLCFNLQTPSKLVTTKLLIGRYFSQQVAEELAQKIGYPPVKNDSSRTAHEVAKRLRNPIIPLLYNNGISVEVMNYVMATTLANKAYPDIVPPVFCTWIYQDAAIGYAVEYQPGKPYTFEEVKKILTNTTAHQLTSAIEGLSAIGISSDKANKNFIVTNPDKVSIIDLLLDY